MLPQTHNLLSCLRDQHSELATQSKHQETFSSTNIYTKNCPCSYTLTAKDIHPPYTATQSPTATPLSWDDISLWPFPASSTWLAQCLKGLWYAIGHMRDRLGHICLKLYPRRLQFSITCMLDTEMRFLLSHCLWARPSCQAPTETWIYVHDLSSAGLKHSNVGLYDLPLIFNFI